MEKEIGFEGTDRKYIIYDDGRLYDIYCKHFRKPVKNYKGYLKYNIYINGRRKGFYVHRLVLQTFRPVEGMEHLQVNHIDCNKENNNLDNLEWCTNEENIRHAFANGLIDRHGERNSQAKLSEGKVLEIVAKLQAHIPIENIACQYNVSQSTVSAIKQHRNWAYLTEGIEF